jgi:hypothetical protein
LRRARVNVAERETNAESEPDGGSCCVLATDSGLRPMVRREGESAREGRNGAGGRERGGGNVLERESRGPESALEAEEEDGAGEAGRNVSASAWAVRDSGGGTRCGSVSADSGASTSASARWLRQSGHPGTRQRIGSVAAG